MDLMDPVSDNGETRPGPYFRCGPYSIESYCCCHGYGSVTIVDHKNTDTACNLAEMVQNVRLLYNE
jgi:hypothetical protein